MFHQENGYVEVMPRQQIRYDLQRASATTPLCRWIASTGVTRCRPMPSAGQDRHRHLLGPAELQSRVPDQPLQHPAGVGRQPEYLCRTIFSMPPAALWAGLQRVCDPGHLPVRPRPRRLPAGGTPYIYCDVLSDLPTNTALPTKCDVGGMWKNQWIQATDRWVTIIYRGGRSRPCPGQATKQNRSVMGAANVPPPIYIEETKPC